MLYVMDVCFDSYVESYNPINLSIMNSPKAIVGLTLIGSLVFASDAAAFGTNEFSDLGPAYTTKQVGFRGKSAKPAPQVQPAAPAPAPAPVAPVRAVPQTRASQMPANIKPGECWAEVLIPAKYTTVQERVVAEEASQRLELIPAVYEDVQQRVLVRAASERIEVVPATYKTVQERVMVRAASSEIEVVPATYKTVQERVMIEPAKERVIEVPAQYDFVEERVLVSPARTEFKKGSDPYGTFEGETGDIICLVEIPAEYKTVRKRVMVSPPATRVETIPAVFDVVEKTVVDTPATTRSVNIPAEFDVVEKTVVDTPATSRKVTIPAEYKTVTVKKLVTPARQNTVTIPATYETVTRTKLVEAAHHEWRRILCEINVTPEVIYNIQRALQARGYNPGTIDGKLSGQTLDALSAFQRKQGLPADSLNYETLDALNVQPSGVIKG